MKIGDFENLLQELLNEEEMKVISYDEQGMLTDHGLTIKDKDGDEFQITIVQTCRSEEES